MVDDQYTGQSGECVTCGRAVELPRFTPGQSTGKRASVFSVRAIAGFTVGMVLLLAIGFVALRYGSQGMQTVRENRMRGLCLQNTEKIAKALNAYALDYGVYPPPTTYAADGITPLHSWRVLILPYLGYQTLYSKFDLDAGWDSAGNQLLVDGIPAEYQSPAATIVAGTENNYFLIIGPGTLFPPTGPLGPKDVSDELAKTILLVEAETGKTSSFQWTQPGDFEISQTSLTIGIDLGKSHNGGTTAATIDGRGHFLRDSMDPIVLKALITPNGGEGLSDDVLD
jgi:hypothetical protein